MASFFETSARGASCRILCATLFLTCGAVVVRAQAIAPPAALNPPQRQTQEAAPETMPMSAAPAPAPCEEIRPVIVNVQSAVNSLDMDHWKLPRQAKNQMEADADSIRQDISGTLSTLLDQAKAAPTELAPQWAVMRNIDALYDVLVRVTTTANMAGSNADANLLTQAQNQLAEARKNLAAKLVADAGKQDKEVSTLRAQLAATPTAGAATHPAGRTVVVNDSPTPHHVRHHAKAAVKPATTKPFFGNDPQP